MLFRIDLIKPKDPCRITVMDLKRCPENAETFFDMIFDLQKYENHLRRVDPLYREKDDIFIDNGDGVRVKLR